VVAAVLAAAEEDDEGFGGGVLPYVAGAGVAAAVIAWLAGGRLRPA